MTLCAFACCVLQGSLPFPSMFCSKMKCTEFSCHTVYFVNPRKGGHKDLHLYAHHP